MHARTRYAQTTSHAARIARLRTWGLIALLSLAFGCADWNEFGEGPTNPHRSFTQGPAGGIGARTDLLHPVAGSVHGSEVGVLTDASGAYYVTSYAPEIHIYNAAGTHQDTFTMPSGAGSRAVPYVLNDFAKNRSTIFTGSEGGGFYAIEVDKSISPFTVTLMDAISSIGTSESSPKRASDGTLYLAEQWGDIHSFDYDPTTGTLTHLATLPIGEVITGGIALYDAYPALPGEEVLVASREGGFYVLDAALSAILWSETTGHILGDEYYAGVTVAERAGASPIALLPMAGRIASPPSANSGRLRAIDLATTTIAWEMTPSATTPGFDEIPGSVSLMHPFALLPGAGANPGDDPTAGNPTTTVDTTNTSPLGGDINGSGIVVNPNDDPNDPDNPNQNPNPNPLPVHLATFASTDAHLYAVDLYTGSEVWSFHMGTPGFDAPVTDGSNVVYVGDGSSVLHAVVGQTGMPIWSDPIVSVGGASDIVKLGVSYWRELIVASGNSAYSLRP